MIRFLLIILVAAAVAWGDPAAAVPVAGLYRAEVLVDAQDEASRREAMRTALAEVLVRVAGRRAVLRAPAVREALEAPGQAVVRYAYRRRPDGGLLLELDYDPGAVAALIRAAGLAPWGAERPLVMLWAAVADDGPERLLTGDDESGLADAVGIAARRRGLPMVLPLGDLTDRARVDVADVRAGFTAPVLEASKRYGADRVVLVRVGRGERGWAARWRLLAEEAAAWASEGATPAQALAAGIDGLAERLAEIFAPASGGVGEARLRVAGVASLADLVRVERYLAGLPAVEEVFLARLEGDIAEFRLRHTGALAILRRSLAIAGIFDGVVADSGGVAARLAR